MSSWLGPRTRALCSNELLAARVVGWASGAVTEAPPRLLARPRPRSNIIAAYGLLRLPPSFPGLTGHTAPAYALVLEVMEVGPWVGACLCADVGCWTSGRWRAGAGAEEGQGGGLSSDVETVS